MMPTALTIAGSDPSGGAGLQADLKTFHQHGVYGMSAVTLLTVQNTQAVSGVEMVGSEFLLAQLDAVLDDIPPRAAKVGALGCRELIEALATRATGFLFPLVIDPVMVSKHGHPLIDDDAVSVLVEKLLPTAFLVTPNRLEASKLTSMAVDSLASMDDAAKAISQMGAKHVLIKGGIHNDEAVDVLLADGQLHHLSSEWIETTNTHGTGCVLSAAITARLAHGDDVLNAIEKGKRFVTEAIRSSPNLGGGCGPVNMHASVD